MKKRYWVCFAALVLAVLPVVALAIPLAAWNARLVNVTPSIGYGLCVRSDGRRCPIVGRRTR